MIYLLTPTGDRPECLALLAGYIAAQSSSATMRWIIVDDGEQPSRVPDMPSNVDKLHLVVAPNNLRENSQSRNMTRGLNHVPDDAIVLVFEDDDAYLPKHIETMLSALETSELVGESMSCYYNVASRRYRLLHSNKHAAMASTGVRGTALKALREVCAAHSTTLDIRLWTNFRGPKKLLSTRNVVGVKGMPGRKGVGAGHKTTFGSVDKGAVLESWLGPELSAVYRSFGVPN